MHTWCSKYIWKSLQQLQQQQQGRALTLSALSVQRYISTRPMFIDVRELSAGAAPSSVTDAATAGVALRDLSQQYKGLLTAVKEEALNHGAGVPLPPERPGHLRAAHLRAAGAGAARLCAPCYAHALCISATRLELSPSPTPHALLRHAGMRRETSRAPESPL